MKKEILFPIFKFFGYYVLFPLLVAISLGYFGFQFMPTLLVDFVVFLSPFLFFILPYQEVKSKIKNRFAFIFVFFVIPYLLVYSLYAYAIFKALSNFGF